MGAILEPRGLTGPREDTLLVEGFQGSPKPSLKDTEEVQVTDPETAGN